MKILQNILFGAAVLLASCGGTRQNATAEKTAKAEPVGPVFSADSAFAYCEAQCAFGPRTMNSEAHDRCGAWIARTFERFGMRVVEQQATLTGYDGTRLRATNIIASYRPELTDRILLCAHWDSRPWADNDPDEQNWRQPVMAANDGASGVAVMLEVARLLNEGSAAAADSSLITHHLSLGVGVDFICFDAEDWGVPQWDADATDVTEGNSWALGAQYWAAHPHVDGYRARYGILLDMVGGRGARFYHEGYSLRYARSIVDHVWRAAETVGYSAYFPKDGGGYITDDHVPVNEVAGIPCIDIIPYYPDCAESSFGPTWHTVNDDMAHINPNTLKAVGQTVIQVLFSAKER